MNRLITIFGAVTVMLWFGALFYNWENEGMSFNAVNALFTGLALIGVLITIRSQNQNSKIQNFENVLFKTIDYQKELLKDLPFGQNNEYFTSFVQLLNTEVNKGVENNSRESFENNYDNCYYKFLNFLEPYFKSLDIILELIEQSDLSEKQKDFYFKLINTLQNREQKIALQYHSQLYVQGETSRRFKRMLYKGKFICLNGEHSEIFDDADYYFEDRRM